ncbi:MAG: FtsX-like permease family protein [Thermoplasmata archaeon]|nr:MAG: FtsX-like permease family protein [Thermoplasmata archaeon]
MTVFLLIAFSDGELENFREGTLALLSPSADIAAHQKEYIEAKNRNEKLEDQIMLPIKDYPALREKLLGEFSFIRFVYHNTKSIEADLFINGKRFAHISFRGVDMYDPEYVTSKIFITEGSFFEQEDKQTILLNSNIKEKLKAEVGDTITIIGRDLFGQAIAQDVVVKGFYMSNIDNPHLNSLALVDMDTYYLISGYYKGEALYVNINLRRGYSIQKAIDELNQWAFKNIPDVRFFDYMKIHPENVHEYEMIRLIVISTCMVILFIVIFGIMNVVSVNLFDRKKEVGIYYCLGAERSYLKRLYTAEILILNLAAGLCGILLGLFFRFLINAIHITTTEQAVQHVFGGNVLNIGLNPFVIIWILAGIGGLTTITSLLSLGSSLKISPVAAIHEVEE